jgi:hypothetical protein
MTDEETQRQRRLAEMMLAQCDGKIVRARERCMSAWTFKNVELPLMKMAHLEQFDFELKIEPREWWFCPRCEYWFDKVLSEEARNKMLLGHRDSAGIICASSFVKVREVLEP